MKKYVDADKLITEIKALKSRKGFLPFENTEITEAYMARGVQFTCDDIVNLIQSLQQEQSEKDLFECPETPIKDAVEVTSRMQYIDEDLKPIAEFIMDYASWNLHKDEWNQPTIEVPLFRVLDALAQRGKSYCDN